MSVVVALKKDGVVYMGCDSQVTSGSRKQYFSNPNNFKIWSVPGLPNCIMGGCGMFRDICQIKTMDNLVDPYKLFKNGDVIDYKFVVEEIFPAIVNRLLDVKFVSFKDDYFAGMDSEFLFAYKDKLFRISSDGSVFEIDNYDAIGSGCTSAINVLNLLATDKTATPADKVIAAVRETSGTDLFVSGQIVLLSTAAQEDTAEQADVDKTKKPKKSKESSK